MLVMTVVFWHWMVVARRTMFPSISLRRLKLYLSLKERRAKQRDRSFQDYIENKSNKKTCILKLFLLSCFLGSVVYCVFWYKSSISLALPYLEVFPQDGVQVMTEKTTMQELFTYEKDPYRIKEVLEKAEHNVTSITDQEVKALQLVMEKKKEKPMCITRIRQAKNISIYTSTNIYTASDFTKLTMGGYFSPKDCRTRHKVAILVPYRDREQNLAIFLYNIHPFLMRQKIEYRIFVLEQHGNELFNRGRLFNAGFQQVQQMGFWPCLVFHDVDLLPTDNRILYTCPDVPRHMCAVVLGNVQLPSYRSLFGGVTAMTKKHFMVVNGYSNNFWGWGGEDNDMFWRLRNTRVGVARYAKHIARYTALPHNNTPVNQYRYEMLKIAPTHHKTDGLSSVQYTVVSLQIRHLYTHILIDINPKKENINKLVKNFIEKDEPL